MIGYLGYCKRVELKFECGRLGDFKEIEGIELLETEEYFFEISFRLFWIDLRTMLLERLIVIEFINIIK